MLNAAVYARCWGLTQFTAVWLLLLSVTTYAQSGSPPLSTPTQQSATEKTDRSTREELAELQRDLAQLKNELGLRQEVARLRQQIEEGSKPTWVLAAPWVALAIVGLAFTVAWFILNLRERVLNWHKSPEAATVNKLAERLAKLEEQLTELSKGIEGMSKSVTAVNGNLNELWKSLAISRLTGGGMNPPP